MYTLPIQNRTMAATTKTPAYSVVDADDIVHSDVIVHGQVITPLFDRRKRELCVSFAAGTFVGFLLLAALVSSSLQHAPSVVPLIPAVIPPTSEPEPNVTAIRPLATPPQNKTTLSEQHQEDESAEQQHQGEQSWWSQASNTVSGWFGGKNHETKVAGGGRDWLINAQTGTVASKLDTSFLVGVGPAPLVLCPKDSKHALIFLQSPSSSLHDIDLVLAPPNNAFVGFANEDAQQYEGFEYFDTVVSPFVDPLSVSYQDDNFLVYDGDYVLDVAWWKIVEDQKVNFIKALDGSTFTRGGGRDWIWNGDGSVSPKLNQELVLGRGIRGLVITQKEKQALHLNHAQELANGDTVPMELSGESEVVGAKETQTTDDGWRYRETALIDESPIRIKYDGNFILTPTEDFALDIAYWKLEEGNSVNFVGGDN